MASDNRTSGPIPEADDTETMGAQDTAQQSEQTLQPPSTASASNPATGSQPGAEAKGIGKHRPGCTCRFCDRIRNQAISLQAKLKANPKHRRRLRTREKRFVQAMSNPKSKGFNTPTQAAILAGYSQDSAEAIASGLLRKDSIQSALLTAFDRLGLSLDYGTHKLKELMECESVALVKDPKTGEVIEKIKLPYWDGRAKGLDQFWRLRGAYPKETELPAGAVVINVPGTESAEIAVGVRVSPGRKTPAGEDR